MAVWRLRDDWDRTRPTPERIAAFRDRMTAYGDPDELARRAPPPEPLADLPLFSPRTAGAADEVYGAVSF